MKSMQHTFEVPYIRVALGLTKLGFSIIQCVMLRSIKYDNYPRQYSVLIKDLGLITYLLYWLYVYIKASMM
jgi:hypothetical protein